MCQQCHINDIQAIERAILRSQEKPVISDVRITAATGMIQTRWQQAVAAYRRECERAVTQHTADLTLFRNIVQNALRDLHTQAELIAMRTTDPKDLNANSYRRIAEMLSFQNSHLLTWIEKLKLLSKDEFKANSVSIVNRLMLYANTAYNQLERAYTESLQIPEMPFYPRDGKTECMMNCYCHWDYRRVDGGWDCYWVLNKRVENCPTCKRRALLANPLQVRNGIILRPLNLQEAFA